MRILHTADWHLGKTLKGVDRTPEIAAALEEVLKIVEEERVELLVAAGDLFDRPQVPAEAEAVFFDFLMRLKELGVPLLGVAGNHDPRARIAAWRGVLGLFGAEIEAELRFFEEGGVRERGALRAALLPFLSERRLVKAAELMEKDVGEQQLAYAERMRKVLENLARGFSPRTANLLVGHLTLEGANLKLGGGEFTFYVGNSYAVPAEALPTGAGYVALGHIHRQQRVSDAPLAYYAGSLIQLDFGEGEDAPRGAILLELEPGRPARVLEEIQARWGKPLKTFRFSLEELERRALELERFPGYAKLALKGRPDPVLRERLLSENPHLLEVVFEVEDAREGSGSAEAEVLGVEEAYRRYHEETYGEAPEEALIRAFRRAREEAEDAAASA